MKLKRHLISLKLAISAKEAGFPQDHPKCTKMYLKDGTITNRLYTNKDEIALAIPKHILKEWLEQNFL